MDVATLGLRVDGSGIATAKRDLDGLTAAGAKAEGMATSLRSKLVALGAGLTIGAIGKKILDESSQAQAALAQLEAAVKSTGGAAGLSVRQLDDMSVALQRVTTFSDEAVKGAQSVLLTFNQIKGDTFTQATAAVADLATRMGGDLKGAALQVGKALQDPVTGLLALRRAGVSFSETQRQVIEDLAKGGKMAEAQALILGELRKEFGGSAEAARNTLGGALEGLKNSWGDLFEVSRDSSGGIIEAINGMAEILPKIRDGFNAFFGGIGLLAVDASVAFYTAMEKMRLGAAAVIGGIGAMLAGLPLVGGLGDRLTAVADRMRDSATGTIAALQAWKQEQYDLVTGTGHVEKAITATAYATDLYAKDTKDAEKAASDLAKAQQRLAQATAEATEREMELHWAVTTTTRDFNERMARGDAMDLINRGLSHGPATGRRRAGAGVQAQVSRVVKLWENALRGVQDVFARTFGNILDRGLNSFRDFAASIKDLFVGLAAQVAAALTAEKLGITTILDNLSNGRGALDGLGKGQKGALAGLAGIGIGYGIGSATGSSAVGLFGGAAGGAMAGFQIGGPMGAVIGGLAGAASGLLGASQAQKEAAKAHEAAVKAFRTAADDFHAFAQGMSPLAAAVRDIQKQRDTLVAGAEELYHGDTRIKLGKAYVNVPADPRRAEEIAKIMADAAAAIARAMQELAKALAETSASLEERRLRASGQSQAADDFRFSMQQADEVRKFVEQYNGVEGSDAVLKVLLEVQQMERDARAKTLAEAQAAEAAAKAAEEAAKAAEAIAKAVEARRAMEDLNVRALTAQGKDTEAETLRFQLAQQREFEDAQKAGRDQTYLDRLKEVQKLESDARTQQTVETAVDAVMAADRASRNGSAARSIQTLTVSQGDTLLGYEAAQTNYLAEIAMNTRGGAGQRPLAATGGMGGWGGTTVIVVNADGSATLAQPGSQAAALADLALGKAQSARRLAVGARRGTT